MRLGTQRAASPAGCVRELKRGTQRAASPAGCGRELKRGTQRTASPTGCSRELKRGTQRTGLRPMRGNATECRLNESSDLRTSLDHITIPVCSHLYISTRHSCTPLLRQNHSHCHKALFRHNMEVFLPSPRNVCYIGGIRLRNLCYAHLYQHGFLFVLCFRRRSLNLHKISVWRNCFLLLI